MEIMTTLNLVFLLFQPLWLGLIVWCLIEVKAMQKATHSIQYVPVEPKFEKITDEVRDALQKDIFDNVN